jgi:NAD(P)-dependent dehydrogenase (short-subunit alcohol dehydrogenase family)
MSKTMGGSLMTAATNRSLDLEFLFSVKGQVALLTDVGGGGSREVAQLLAAAGAQVFIADRDLSIAQATLAKVTEAGGRGTALQADIEDEASVIALFDKVVSAAGRLDILVNCAGMVANQPLVETTTQIWDDVQSLNLRANFLCMREGVKRMLAAGRGGRIVNITTIGARHPVMHGNQAYGAARQGVSALSRNTALDYAKDGILVNTILAGKILDKVATHPSTIEALKAGRQLSGPIHAPGRTPLGTGEMTDVAAAVLYLVSPAGRYITGHELALDGGFFVS